MAISKNNTRVLVTMPKELKAQLEKLAKENNRSLSNFIVTVLQEKVTQIADSSHD